MKTKGYTTIKVLNIVRVIFTALAILMMFFSLRNLDMVATMDAGMAGGTMTDAESIEFVRTMLLEQIGRAFFPLFFVAIQLFMILKKRYKPLLIATIVLLIVDIGSFNLGFIFSIIQLLILTLSKPTKAFLKQENTSPEDALSA